MEIIITEVEITAVPPSETLVPTTLGISDFEHTPLIRVYPVEHYDVVLLIMHVPFDNVYPTEHEVHEDVFV